MVGDKLNHSGSWGWESMRSVLLADVTYLDKCGYFFLD